MWQHVAELYFPLWLTKIPSHCTLHCLPVHLLGRLLVTVNNAGVSNGIQPPECLLLILLGVCTGVELRGHVEL